MARGAVLGALNGYTDADPEADRSEEVLTGGAAGGLLGAGADVAGAVGSKGLKMLRTQGSKEKETAGAIAKWVRGKLPAKPAPAVPTPVAAPSTPVSPPVRPIRPSFTRVQPSKPIRPLPSQPPTTPAAAPANGIDASLESIISKLRASQPGEVGNVIGDAELAMGKGAPQPDLEALLRRSIIAKGGVPVSP
jgi:hypothetical protein